MRTYAQLTTSFVVFVQPGRRRRVDLVLGRLRGHRPGRRPLFSAPLYDEGLFVVDVDLADVRRERIALPLLRDERPELEVRELERIVPSGPASPTTRPPPTTPNAGLDVAPDSPRIDGSLRSTTAARGRRPAGCRCSSCPTSSRSTRTSRGGSSASSSAASCSQAGFERAVLGLSGGIDSALVAYLVAEAIGADKLLAVLMPYRTSSPDSRGDAEEVVAALGCAWSWSTSRPMVDGYFDGTARTAATPSPLRRGNFMARMRMAVAVRPLGDLGRARRRHRQQDRVAHRLHDAVRRQRRARSTRSATCTRARSASSPRRSACPTRSSARRRRPTCGPARPTRPRRASRYPELDRLLFWLVDRRRSIDELVAMGFDRRDRRAGRPDGRRLRVQAPGAADREARPAHGRRRLPLSAAAARVRPDSDRRGRGAARSTSSPRRSATSATSRCARSRCCAPCR